MQWTFKMKATMAFSLLYYKWLIIIFGKNRSSVSGFPGVAVLPDWLPPKPRETCLQCYLVPSWCMGINKSWIHTFSQRNNTKCTQQTRLGLNSGCRVHFRRRCLLHYPHIPWNNCLWWIYLVTMSLRMFISIYVFVHIYLSKHVHIYLSLYIIYRGIL